MYGYAAGATLAALASWLLVGVLWTRLRALEREHRQVLSMLRRSAEPDGPFDSLAEDPTAPTQSMLPVPEEPPIRPRSR